MRNLVLSVAVLMSQLAFAQATDAPVQVQLQPSAHLLDASASAALHGAAIEATISAVTISIGAVLLLDSVLAYLSVNNLQPAETQQGLQTRGLGFGLVGAASVVTGLRLIQLALDKIDSSSPPPG